MPPKQTPTRPSSPVSALTANEQAEVRAMCDALIAYVPTIPSMRAMRVNEFGFVQLFDAVQAESVYTRVEAAPLELVECSTIYTRSAHGSTIATTGSYVSQGTRMPLPPTTPTPWNSVASSAALRTHPRCIPKPNR